MLCPDCFRGTIHNHGPGAEEVKGYEETIHSKRTYIATPTTAADSQSTILFVTDAFGIHFINNKMLADKYAVKRHRPGARLVCVSHLFRICFASV